MSLQKLFIALSLASSFLSTTAQSPGSTQNGDLPPGSSGQLRGSESLLGYDGNPTVPEDNTVLSNPEYVTGQKEDVKLGLYLDFNDVEHPQAVRGSKGGTDPGHREPHLCILIYDVNIYKAIHSTTKRIVTYSRHLEPILAMCQTRNGLWV